jgi:small-conductance mechanosensitive channel
MLFRETARILRALIASRSGKRFAAMMISIAIVTAVAARASGASPTPSQSLARSPSAKPSAASNASAKLSAAATPAAAVPISNPPSVLGYLSNAINWYRQLNTEAQLVQEPRETLFYSEDRQTAADILELAFDYARDVADFLAKSGVKYIGGAARGAVPGATAGLGGLDGKVAALQTELAQSQARLKSLQDQMTRARGAQRATLASQIQATEGEIDLAQARSDALASILQFQTGTSAPEQANGLRGQIDELERSIPELERNSPHNTGQPEAVPTAAAPAAAPVPAPMAQASEPSGTMGIVFDLFAVRRKIDGLDRVQTGTSAFIGQVKSARDPFMQRILELDQRGAEFAKSTTGSNAAELRIRKKDFDALIEEHKALVTLSLPLTKQLVLLDVYSANLDRWRTALGQRLRSDIRGLSIRLGILAITLLLIFGVSILWKQLTFRYVRDIRRRGQALAARRFVVGLLVIIVLLINFADQLGSFATILGFAAAGVAVALQNVILSIAGYFFLIGRFGIKVGDRVQIGGVTGDVVEIGLVKLSLMELGGNGNHLQPTGRVVVFSNAIVFQPNGNFFKQAPGTSFVWNEIRLTLAPDCDYRLTEKRLTDAVEQVFGRYREQVQRDYRHLERDLNILLESPKPQSRLSLNSGGLEVIIRYPAETRNAPQIADEVTRRVLDAIAREPSLRLVTGTANIQPVTLPPTADGAPAEAEKESA